MRIVSRNRFLKIVTGLFLALAAATGILRIAARPATDHPFFRPEKFLVIAHRGGRSLGPENTLYTFQRAIERGTDVLEMDIRVTRDNHLVVLHDETVNRTTDGTGRVADYRLADLKSLDAGFHWSPDRGGSYPLRANALRVPTLQEVFRTFPQTPMNIEIKDTRPQVVSALCRLIQATGMAEKIMVACFDTSVLKKFRRQCPRVSTSAGFSEAAAFYSLKRLHLQSIYSPDALALQVPEKYGDLTVVDRRFVDAAHQRNMSVHVWTVNDPDDMRRLVALGVDGIMTDDPQRLLQVLKNGRRN